MAKPLPGIDVPVLTPAGTMSQTWYDYFQSHQKLTQLPDVSNITLTNGMTLVYNATTKLWVPT